LHTDKSPQEIFEEIKILRYLDLDEENFYQKYLELSSVICKSKYACYFDYDGLESDLKASLNNPSEQFINDATSLIQKAYKHGVASQRYSYSDSGFDIPFVVVFKNFNHDSVVAMLIDKSIQSSFNESLVRMQLVCDTPYSYFLGMDSEEKDLQIVDDSKCDTLKNPLELFNILIDKKDFNLASLTLVNELAFRFGASCVSVGWMEIDRVVTKGVSFIEDFQKNSDTINLLESLFEETFLQNEVLIYPTLDISLALYECEKYYTHKKVSQLVSIPIHYEGEVCGVIVFEMIDDALDDEDIDLIKLIVDQISPWLNTLHHKQEPLHKKIYNDFIEYFEEKFSIEYSGLKLSLTIVTLVFLLSLIVEIDYKVEAPATLETDYVTYISAPYEGVVESVDVVEGQDVKKDELLLKLDTNELKLKKNETKADISRYTQEAEKARATFALADMKIALSKREEAKSNLERLEYYISQSQIKSPYDGVIIDGDRTKLLGSPVNKGDVMIKVAKIDSMYLKIKVSEEDIDNILDSGEFIFLSRPDKKYNFRVDKIIPMAEVDKSNGNVFIVKAFIDAKQDKWWRAGMSGVTKIDGGDKSIFWVVTHKMSDFMRIYLWW
jgi:biotin carboxyl carrier protein